MSVSIKEKYKDIMIFTKKQGKDIYPLLGIKHGSYKNALSGKNTPLWVKAFVVAFELGRNFGHNKQTEINE